MPYCKWCDEYYLTIFGYSRKYCSKKCKKKHKRWKRERDEQIERERREQRRNNLRIELQQLKDAFHQRWQQNVHNEHWPDEIIQAEKKLSQTEAQIEFWQKKAEQIK